MKTPFELSGLKVLIKAGVNKVPVPFTLLKKSRKKGKYRGTAGKRRKKQKESTRRGEVGGQFVKIFKLDIRRISSYMKIINS